MKIWVVLGFGSLLLFRWAHLKGDVISGLTTGLSVLPQGLAYGQIAELPAQVGIIKHRPILRWNPGEGQQNVVTIKKHRIIIGSGRQAFSFSSTLFWSFMLAIWFRHQYQRLNFLSLSIWGQRPVLLLVVRPPSVCSPKLTAVNRKTGCWNLCKGRNWVDRRSLILNQITDN